MTIQIDDAGWGSLVGPTFVGAYRPETDEFAYGAVDLRFFRGRAFACEGYLQETTRVIQELLEELGADGDEPVEMCTGYIFDHAHRNLGRKVKGQKISLKGQKISLKGQKISLKGRKITGRLQELIEQVTTDYLLSMDIPIAGVEPGSKHFTICLDWVAEDLEEREKFVKTGWKSWCTKWHGVAQQRGGVNYPTSEGGSAREPG